MKNTKTKLISSVAVLLICFAMLIGSTFAWFTDSASTGVNKIQAGKLQIGLEMKGANGWENAEGKTLDWVADRAQDQILWEPGAKYKLPTLKITNKGNLALQFKVLINGVSGNLELLDALEFSYAFNWMDENGISVDSGTFEGSEMMTMPYEIPLDTRAAAGSIDADPDADFVKGYILTPESASFPGMHVGYYTLQAHMKESAGNTYQGMSLKNMSVTIVATQVAGIEVDSTDDMYDKNAEYPNVAAAKVTTENNLVKDEVTVSTATKNADGNPIATVTIPVGVKVAEGVNTITTTVEPTATPSNANVAVTSDSQTFEVKAEGLADGNDTPLKIETFIGKNLSNVTLLHNGQGMTKKGNISALTNDQDYYYDRDSGYVTFLSKSFSPFTATYDKKAPIVYPAGVTTESFEQATSVYYYGTYGGGSNVRVATGDEILNHPAAVAYVDTDGVVYYAADVYCAVANGATAIYCKENATLKVRSVGTNRTEDLMNDLAIHANGADFQYGEIALNSTTTATQDITVKVYDAKNLYIWGYSPAGGKALTVLMENCHNVGTSETDSKGRMFYISNNNTRTNGTIHATLNSCSVEKSDSPVYMNADGSLTLKNCTFAQCAVPVNNNYKSADARTDVVKDCKFINCGCTAEMNSGIASYAAPIRFVKSGSGILTVTLENNTFNGTIGTNGDILLGDYRTPGKSFAFDATIVTANPVIVKSSNDAAYSYNGGTVNVLDY